jgi:hypothetical protein
LSEDARIKEQKKESKQTEKGRRKMPLHQQNEFSIPEETTRVARAAYPKGNIYLKMRDA